MFKKGCCPIAASLRMLIKPRFFGAFIFKCFFESKLFNDMLQSIDIGDRVMDVARRDMHVGNDVVLMIYRSMIQVEETFRFAISNHITTFRICRAHFNLFLLVHLLP